MRLGAFSVTDRRLAAERHEAVLALLPVLVEQRMVSLGMALMMPTEDRRGADP